MPYGFCGLDIGCTTEIVQPKRNRAITIYSTCIYHHTELNYKRAVAGSNVNPCTNIPITCHLCPRNILGEHPTVWKYNMVTHIWLFHVETNPNSGVQKLPIIPGTMLVDMYISKLEERRMGIGEAATAGYRLDNDLPGSEDPAIMESTQKRGRTGTMESAAEGAQRPPKRR